MTEARRNQNLTFEDCRMVFKNFSGAEGQYNRAGDRNFALLVSHEDAAKMKAQGWNIKELQPREEGDDTQPYIKVKVSFPKNGRPPRIVLITSAGKTELDEETVGMIDWAHIKKVDLIIRPYDWEVHGNTGRTAYLKSLFVTIEEDELDLKYANVPDSAQTALTANATPWELEDMGEIEDQKAIGF